MRGTTAGWALMLTASLALGACGRHHHDGSGSDSSSASSASSDESADERANDKLNGYVKGYNGLIGTFGLGQQFQQYLGQQIAQKGVNDPVFVNIGWVDNGLGSLQAARAIKGGPHDLDAAADPLIGTLQQLTDRLKGLNIYYQSRGQTQDNFARGKREDPLVIAEYKTALAQLQPLSDAIDHEQDVRDQKELAALKSQGDMVGYDAALALQKAKAMIGLFNGPADVRDPAKFGKGDGLVTQIQAALDDERAELAKGNSGKDPTAGLRNSMDTTAAERLETMIGHYRDLKQTGNPFNYQMMVSSYNDAIQQHNYGQL